MADWAKFAPRGATKANTQALLMRAARSEKAPIVVGQSAVSQQEHQFGLCVAGSLESFNCGWPQGKAGRLQQKLDEQKWSGKNWTRAGRVKKMVDQNLSENI